MKQSVDPKVLLARLKGMTHEEMASTLALLEELEVRKRIALAQADFLAFIAAVDPAYKFGNHLKRLGSLLMSVEGGFKDRIAVSMAPRMGKSLMISVYFPAWYLGKQPDHKVIMASHTADLAVDMARKVRNLMQSEEYRLIFPGVAIAADAKAAGKWNTTKGGEVFATGVGGAIAGRGGHLIVVDDPISEQEIKAGNTDSLDGVYEWFRSGLRTRLMPGGRVCILHCLTGDTRILLANGAERLLRDIRPGDMVAGYENGTLRPAKVLGWANQGLDRIYAIALKSGKILRGNERHPFLVRDNGVDRWVKVRDLRRGMRLVSMTAAQTRPTPEEYGGYAKVATTESTYVKKPKVGFLYHLKNGITRALRKGVPGLGGLNCALVPAPRATHEHTSARKTPTPSNTLWGITVSGEASSAKPMAASGMPIRSDTAYPAETRFATPSVRLKALIIVLKPEAVPTSSRAMGSLALGTTSYSLPKAGPARFAPSLHTRETPRVLGKCADWLSTTATRLVKFARSCATNATSSSKAVTPSSGFAQPLNILSATTDEIVSITPDGEEDVFDIQVEGTENFIANGVVSHNTRWHQRDLIGRLVKDAAMNPDADQYEVFEFPAILTTPNPEYDPDEPESPSELLKSLWPEQWPVETLLRTKASMPAWQWNAQYMQNPTAQEAAIIKRDDIRWWPKDTPPDCDFVVQAWDTAMTTKERSDYSVCQTWGVWKTEEGVDQVILLNCVRRKVEFPELKRIAFEQAKEWEPDALIVEAKASGQPLIDELRRSGIFVQDFSPGKGQDKIARVNAVADMFASGQVWFPETHWATEVVEEILAFPSGEHDDCVDTMTLALRRVRQGGLFRLTTDYEEPDLPSSYRRRAAYY